MQALAFLLALSATFPALPGAGPDTLIIEVLLSPGDNRAVMLAEMREDSSITLNGSTLGRFLGIDLPPLVSIEDLTERVGAAVLIMWIPSRLRLAIIDTYGTLPATRQRLDELMAAGRAQPDLMSGGRGIALAYARDDTGADQVEIGYVASRAAAFVSRSSQAGFAWSVSAAPIRRLWLSYRDDDAPGTSYNIDARLAVGTGFVALSYREDGEFGAQAATALGPLAAFADPFNHRYVVTLRGRIDAQLARVGERFLMRVSYGALDPSAFGIPYIRSR